MIQEGSENQIKQNVAIKGQTYQQHDDNATETHPRIFRLRFGEKETKFFSFFCLYRGVDPNIHHLFRLLGDRINSSMVLETSKTSKVDDTSSTSST